MFKTYKYRLYPNKKQTEQIQKTFGCCRFVYNQVLNYRINLYENEKKSINKFDCNNYTGNFTYKPTNLYSSFRVGYVSGDGSLEVKFRYIEITEGEAIIARLRAAYNTDTSTDVSIS